MAQVTIDVPDGLAPDLAKRVATEAMLARAATGRVEAVLSRSERPVGPGLLAQVALHDEAWREIEERWGMLSADQVTAATGGNQASARSHTSNLRRRKGLAAVKRNGALRYPGFQFVARGALKFEVAAAWTALAEALAPAGWGQADILMWAASPNAWLDGGSPADEIQQHPDEPTERLLLAAHQALPDGVRGTRPA
jgi:hypothetical protein